MAAGAENRGRSDWSIRALGQAPFSCGLCYVAVMLRRRMEPDHGKPANDDGNQESISSSIGKLECMVASLVTDDNPEHAQLARNLHEILCDIRSQLRAG